MTILAGTIEAASGPNWAEIVTALFTALLGLGVLVAIFQLRELRRDRHLQWIFEIGRRWNEEKLEESRQAQRSYSQEALANKTRRWLDPNRPPDPDLEQEMLILERTPDFFEDVALMVEYGDLDLGLVWQSLSGPAEFAWAAWEDAIHVYREIKDPQAYTEFARLVSLFGSYDPSAKPTRSERLRRWGRSFF